MVTVIVVYIAILKIKDLRKFTLKIEKQLMKTTSTKSSNVSLHRRRRHRRHHNHHQFLMPAIWRRWVRMSVYNLPPSSTIHKLHKLPRKCKITTERHSNVNTVEMAASHKW